MPRTSCSALGPRPSSSPGSNARAIPSRSTWSTTRCPQWSAIGSTPIDHAGHVAILMDESWPAQEARRAPHGMIATVNPLASAAGLRILRHGGNAVDAAIAAGAVPTAGQAFSGQLGGDGFMFVATPRPNTVTASNRRGAAPPAPPLGAV